MATQTLFQEDYLALTRTVKQWDQRLRLRQSLAWLPISVMPGLVVGILAAVIARLRPLLPPEQIALIAGISVAAGVVVMLLAVWLWRRPALTSARRFDVLLGLNERVSTALEISTGTIQTNDELAQRQLADARSRASAVRVGDHLPLTLHRRDWLTVLVLILVLALLLVLPNPQSSALAAASAQQTAITDAADTLRDLTGEVAADASLTDEQRRALLQELQSSINTLEQPNVTPEEAFAAVSDVQSTLKDRADALNQQAQANQSALAQAADMLRQAGQQPNNGNPNQSASASIDQISQSLNDMMQNAADASEAERQAMEQALRDAAQSLEGTNPEAAQQLAQAAQNMQQGDQQQGAPQQGQTQGGDPQSAQDAQQNLAQAQQEIQQQAAQTQQQQAQAQSMQSAADQAQQSADQISQAQQQAAPNNQPGDQAGRQAQPGQQAGQSPSSESQPQQGQAGQQQGDQQSEQAQVMQSLSGGGQQDSNQPQMQNQPSQSTSSGAGDTSGGAGDELDQQSVRGNQDDANNHPDGQGQRQFEPVNVPRRVGGQSTGDNNIQLGTIPATRRYRKATSPRTRTGR